MAEELTLDQTDGNRAAVNLEQRPIFAPASIVNRAPEAPCRSRLTADEHGGLRRRHPFQPAGNPSLCGTVRLFCDSRPRRVLGRKNL